MNTPLLQLPLAIGLLLGMAILSPGLPGATAEPPATLPDHSAHILTPRPGPAPRLTGPRVFGVRPGRPIVHRLTATGERPLTFSLEGAPAGVICNPATGQFGGSLASPGEHRMIVRVRNAHGTARREFRLVVGPNIALTPPLGWNSWNSWARDVTQENIAASARAMVSTGLADHGWAYINVDDAWQGVRGANRAIQPNEKFPDMKGLADEIHGLGLKFGIYSTPFSSSYAGYIGGTADNPEGAWQRVPKDKRPPPSIGRHSFCAQDVAQWVAWGVDYLKYDWYPLDVKTTREMSRVLREAPRDIVYSLSNSAHIVHGSDYAALANLWRITGDIRDEWLIGEPKQNLQGIVNIWNQHGAWRQYNGPGHWNDPDMLVVGLVGWSKDLRPTRLTPDEQYTHISLWCLWSAPLLIGCPLERLDPFTISLLTNDEVLDVNQDPLGHQAELVAKDGPLEVWAKPLEDGSRAVGLFNRGETDATVTVRWPQLGIAGAQLVRDLWRQRDFGRHAASFGALVRAHGVVLVRIAPSAGGS